MLNVSIPLCIRKCSHQNTFQWNNLLFHGIDTCNSRHPKFSRYSPVNREIKSTFNWHRHKQSDHSTYRHAFAFIFDIYADAHTLGLIISLESRTIALFLPTITFTSCMFFHFDQFFVQQFHFTALVLWFVDLSTANNNRNKKSDLCFEIYISKTLISTSNTMLFVSNGWHERRLLVQHPPHRLTRVQGGKTRMVGSFASDPSANFNGTTVISGTQLAGVAILPADRSTASPPKRAATNQIESINPYFNHLFSFRKLLWFNSGTISTIWKPKTCSLHSWKHATTEMNISNTIWHRMRYSTGLAVQSKAVNVLNAFFGVMFGHNMSRTLSQLWHVDRLKRDQHMNKRKFNEFKSQTNFLY